MEVVVTELMHYKLGDEHTGHHANRKTKNINERERLVPGNVTEDRGDVTSNHEIGFVQQRVYLGLVNWLQGCGLPDSRVLIHGGRLSVCRLPNALEHARISFIHNSIQYYISTCYKLLFKAK